jgi:hypothetical protein
MIRRVRSNGATKVQIGNTNTPPEAKIGKDESSRKVKIGNNDSASRFGNSTAGKPASTPKRKP